MDHAHQARRGLRAPVRAIRRLLPAGASRGRTRRRWGCRRPTGLTGRDPGRVEGSRVVRGDDSSTGSSDRHTARLGTVAEAWRAGRRGRRSRVARWGIADAAVSLSRRRRPVSDGCSVVPCLPARVHRPRAAGYRWTAVASRRSRSRWSGDRAVLPGPTPRRASPPGGCARGARRPRRGSRRAWGTRTARACGPDRDASRTTSRAPRPPRRPAPGAERT